MCANEDNLKEMLRIIQYVLATKGRGLKMSPQMKYDEKGKEIYYLKGVCDASWCSDRKTGLSVSGYIIYFMNVPISWRSKSQRHVTLSSTESEFVCISEVAKEILYVKQILDNIGMGVELPIKIYCDNVGAIYMSTGTTKPKDQACQHEILFYKRID